MTEPFDSGYPMTTTNRDGVQPILVNPDTERPQVVIVGAGLAGVNAARRLERHAKREELDILLVSKAVADPLGIPMSALVAKVVTKGYHLYALPRSPTASAS